MKKTLLAMVISSVLPAAAFADVIVYGKANVALQSTDEVALSTANGNQADGSKIELQSNSSRIGVKGGEEVNSKLKVIYQFEYQTEVDDGTNGSQTFGQRNIYLGLQGSAGTFMGGHFDTPTKLVQEKVDLFNDLEGDITHIFKGEIRASNTVQYITPTFGGGFSGSIAYVTEENDGVTKKAGEAGNGISGSFGYNSPTFYVGVGVDQDVEAEGVDLIRVVGRLTLGAFQFGVLGENYDNGTIDENGAMVSAMWNVTDKWAVKAQHGSSEVKWIDGESSSIGVDYKMTKSATLYGYYTLVENGQLDLVTVDSYRDDNYAGIGMDYKF